MTIRVRAARPDDAAALAQLINQIIAIGGTTAHETPFDAASFAQAYLTGPDALCCHVAESVPGQPPLGFQSLSRNPDLAPDWGDIGTFARAEPKVAGVGTALFAATRVAAQTLGLSTIFAVIRADNSGGLAYYSRMGFVDWQTYPGVPLRDGTRVDRIAKLFHLPPAVPLTGDLGRTVQWTMRVDRANGHGP